MAYLIQFIGFIIKFALPVFLVSLTNMKRSLIIFALLLFAVTAKAQNYTSPGIPSGTTSLTPTFRTKAATPDSLAQIWLAIGGNKFYRLSTGMDVIVFKATDFEGAGTTSSKLGLRDTLLKSNWIIKSTSTSLPGLTIDAENSDLTTPTITVFKFNGNRVSAIGSAGGYFGRGVFANSGGDYASVFTDTTGTLISRKKADSNPVLRLINLSSGSTGDFLFAGDSTSTKFRITRQGGIIAPLLTDTTGLTKSIVWNPSTGKFYTQTGGGGGNTIYTHDDSLRNGDRLVQQNQHNLEFDSYDPVNNLSGATILQPAYQNMTVNDSIGGAAQIGATTRLGNNQSQAFISVNTPGGGTDKLIQMNSKPNGYSLDTKGIYFREHIDSVGLLYQDTVSFKYGKRYNTWIPNWGSVKSRIDSAISAGSGTVTSITPGVGFLSHTPITTSGTMNIDTASTIVTKTFAGRYVTNSSTTTFTNKTGNISQWTNDSGYITSASVPVAANPTASVGGSPVNGSATTFMRSDAAPKADTSVLQTVLNLFPKTDTRYKHDFTIAGHSIASNFNTTLATLSYGYGIALQSGTSSYDASGGSTFRVDTGTTIQTVANFFPKGDTRYLKISSAFSNPMTTTGDIIYSSSGSTPARLAIGGANTVLHGGTTPSYSSVANADLANSTISGVALGGTLGTLTFGTHLTSGGSSYTGAAGVTITSDATTANTASTIVARDGSGGFSMGALNAANITGNTISGGVSFTNPRSNLQAANFDGYATSNTQAATSGVPNQWSPSIRSTAEVWNTTATAANNFTDWITFVKTNSGAVPTSSYTWSSSLTTTSTPSYTQRMTLDNSGNLTMLTGTVILHGYTVSGLPTGVTGMTAYVTDALTPASLATVVGGGASVVPVFYNGSNWIVQ